MKCFKLTSKWMCNINGKNIFFSKDDSITVAEHSVTVIQAGHQIAQEVEVSLLTILPKT